MAEHRYTLRSSMYDFVFPYKSGYLKGAWHDLVIRGTCFDNATEEYRVSNKSAMVSIPASYLSGMQSVPI